MVAYPGFFSRINIYGKNGSAALVDDELKFVILKNGENFKKELNVKKTKLALSPKISFELHEKQLRNFIDAIINNVPLDVKREDERNALAIVLSLYKSFKAGKVEKNRFHIMNGE